MGARTLARIAMLPVCAILALTVHAQFDSGAVLGSIKDNSGAVVGGVAVELTNVAKRARTSHQADANGSFEFDSLQPGDYLLVVTSPGFQSSRTQNFHIDTGSRLWRNSYRAAVPWPGEFAGRHS